MASPGFVRRSHELGKQVFVWTVNDAVTLSRMMSLGVDGVITDEPALAREVIAERADLNPAERLLMHTAILFGKPEPQRHYRDESP
jgi:glycerophosphoryl diester phosphodiesterase